MPRSTGRSTRPCNWRGARCDQASYLYPPTPAGVIPGSAQLRARMTHCNLEHDHVRQNKTFRLCRHVRAHHRRPGAAGRYRSHHRGREGFYRLRRGSEIRRRQGDPRRHGAVPGHQQAGRGRYRHHQCADRRPLGHRQGRRRHQGRLYQRHRQGGQSRHPARRHHRDRPRHRRDRGRGQDPHRRRVRQPHPFHLPAADRARADVRRHLDAGRRHRPVARHLCHHLHARALAHGADDPVVRRLPGQSRHFRQGQRLAAGRAGRDDQGRRLRAETARGLGHHAGGDRQLSFGGRRLRRPGHDPFRHAE